MKRHRMLKKEILRWVETLDWTKRSSDLSAETGLSASQISTWRMKYKKGKAAYVYKANPKVWKKNASRQAKEQRILRAERGTCYVHGKVRRVKGPVL